jgi:PAS domain S-box-containing protein
MTKSESADASQQIFAAGQGTNRLQLAAEAASLGTWDYDPISGKRTWSDQFRALIGMPPDAEPDFEQYIAAVHPDDRDAVRERHDRAFDPASGGEYESEYRLRRQSDGVERWIASKGRVFFDGAGRPIRAVGTLRDITGRKRLEEEQRRWGEILERQVEARTSELAEANQRLRESEASYRALYRKAPVPLHSLDAAGRFVDVNEQWLDLFGYQRDEVIGRSITDFHAVPQNNSYAPRWREMLDKGHLRDLERQFVTKSGRVVDTLLSAQVEQDAAGKFRRVISAVIDVTARKEAERALRRERQFSELLVESSTEGIAAIDTEFRYTLWNPGIETMTGTTRGQALGRTVFEVFPYLEGTDHETGWREALRGRRMSFRDMPGNNPGGSDFMDADYAPLHGADGSIIGAIAFKRETTDRREMEAQLRQAQKMEAVGQLTGGVAHDFNNFLTSIIGNLELISKKLTADDPMQRLAESALRAADRGARLTQHLLAFARRQRLHPEVLDINEILGEMATLYRQVISETIEVSFDLTADLWRCRADPGQFESAVLNLIVNARDAMSGSGRLTLATANLTSPKDVDLPPGDYVLLSLSDTGAGMTSDVLAHAFEPFFSTKEVGKGSGLGLSMVYGFAKQSGGTVRIESVPGAGTTVSLYLPRTDSMPAASDAPKGDLALTPHGSPTVLVVEDNDEVRQTTAEVLTDLGYRVLVASNGPDALALLRQGKAVDLLLSDIVMPGGMSGITLVREARRLREVRALLTTGYAAEAIGDGDGDGDTRFMVLKKPYRRRDLGEAVQLALDGGTVKSLPSMTPPKRCTPYR